MSLLLQGLIVAAALWVLWRLLRSVKSPLDNIPGPSANSMLYGNFPELFNRHGWVVFQDTIDRQYGSVVKIKGIFGKPALYVYDPKALYHIIVKDQHVYKRAAHFVAFIRLTFGDGLFGTSGEQHHKQRKMLYPVFSANNMRSMTPMFYQCAHRLCEAISREITTTSTGEVDMLKWMSRITLELIGQGGLGYSFDPLVATVQNSFGDAMKALAPTIARCFTWRILAHHYPKFGPASVRRWLVNLIPDANVQLWKSIVDTMYARSKEILADKLSALRVGDEAFKEQVGEGKDIMSILLRANMSTVGDDRLSEEELIAQMTTLVFAATDTTTCALACLLNLLTKHLDVQDRLVAEINEAGHGQDIPYDQLDNLPYLDAVCRETLRLHPPASLVPRQTERDIVLPFSEPIEGIDGTMMNEVVVPKGTTIIVGIRSCNRSKAIWGEDALEWKPERWLSSEAPASPESTKVPGVYSNMMTFLGGGNACIGFKFSLLEMKVILAVLLSSFKFSSTGKDIYWNFAAVNYPTVGPDTLKPSMPLKVEPLTGQST